MKNVIKMNYQQEAEEKQKNNIDNELPFLTRDTRNLLIKELKDIKNQLMIMEMKQKRIEDMYKGEN